MSEKSLKSQPTPATIALGVSYHRVAARYSQLNSVIMVVAAVATHSKIVKKIKNPSSLLQLIYYDYQYFFSVK
jgi:hypothetical protein